MRKVFLASLFLLLGVFFFKREIKDIILATDIPEFYCEHFRDLGEFDKDHVITKLDNNMKIIVNKHDRCVCRVLRVTGKWDESELSVVRKIVKPGFNVIEVGANFGCYTLVMADMVGKEGKIYAFEANSKVFKYLEESVKLNKLENIINVYNNAASDKSYNGMMVYGISNIGAGYIINESDPEKLKKICENNSSCVPIKSITLDSLFFGKKIDLLKIDAEGFEPFIINGSDKIIKDNNNIILMMEWISSHMKRNIKSIESFLNKLKSYGFFFFVVKNGKLQEISDAELLSDAPLDIVACRSKELINGCF